MSKTGKRAIVAAAAADAPDTKRRNFLIGAGVGSAAAAAALVGGKAGVPVAPSAAPADPVSDDAGYRETEHIRRYYGTTRI